MGTLISSRPRFDCEGSKVTQEEDACLSQDLPPLSRISSRDRQLGTILSMAQAGKYHF